MMLSFVGEMLWMKVRGKEVEIALSRRKNRGAQVRYRQSGKVH